MPYKTLHYSILAIILIVFGCTHVNAQWIEEEGDNPPPRLQHTMIDIEGVFYVFGGKDDLSDLGDTWAFENGQWVNKYPALAPGPRHGHTAVVANGKMYLFGGSGGGFLLNDLWEYCPENNTWKLITTSGTGPSPRKGQVAIYYAPTNTIYIMGGTTSEGGSSELFAFDLSTNQWIQKADMLNFDVTNHGAGILNDILIIFGGNSLFAPFSDHFFTYDLATDTWDSIDDIFGDDFFGRSDFAFTQTDDAILVFGGTNDDLVFENPFSDQLMIEMDDDNGIMISQFDPEPIFADGFESGDASAWTDGVPKGASSGSIKILLFGGISGDNYINSTWLYAECETITESIEVSICDGESFEGYETSGVYEDTFEVSLGCDSVRTLTLSVVPAINTTVTMELCHGDSYEGYSESGTYEDSFISNNGCDSIRTLELTIDDPITESLEMSVCYGETYEGYSESGIYEDTFLAVNGCDSLRILDLTVGEQIVSSLMTTICPDESFEGYTEAGIYEDVFTAADGCDSTRTLNLEIAAVIELTDTMIVADNGSSSGSIEVWINANNDAFTFEWSNGETSSAISDLGHGDYSVTVTDEFDCSEIFDFTVQLNTSTENLEEVQIEIFPNPANGYLNVHLSAELSTKSNFQIDLFTAQGELARHWSEDYSGSNIKLDLDGLESGLYMLTIFGDRSMYSEKILIIN